MVKTKRMDKLEYIPGDLVMVKESVLQFAKNKIFKVISSLRGGFVKVVMLNDSSIIQCKEGSTTKILASDWRGLWWAPYTEGEDIVCSLWKQRGGQPQQGVASL